MKGPTDRWTTTDRTMRMLDEASHIFGPGAEPWHSGDWHSFAQGDITPESARAVELDYLRAIAASLSAIAFLLMRRDEEMASAWERW